MELKKDDIAKFDIPNSEKEILNNFIKNKDKFCQLNIFMIICFKEQFLKDKNISFYFMRKNDKKICNHIILNQSKSDQIFKDEICDLFLIKIDLNYLTDKLHITLKKEIKEEYNGNIIINKHIGINNYFCFDNFIFHESDLLENKIVNLSIDTIFNQFSRYFLEKNPHPKMEIDMIKSLLGKKKIPLSSNNIFKLIKYCSKYKFYYINLLEKLVFQNQIKSYIEKEYILSDDDLYYLINMQNSELFVFIVKLYIFILRDKNILSDLFCKSKFRKEFNKVLFALIKDKSLVARDLSFFQEKTQLIQSNLLDEMKEKKDFNYIIDISPNLEYALQFILHYFNKINQKLDSLWSFFNNLKLNLNNIEINDDINIDSIYFLINEIIKISSDNSILLINYEGIFESLDKKLYSEDINNLDIYCKLRCFKPLFGRYIKQEIDKYYDRVHMKGLNLIKNKKMNIEEIIKFISKQDIYYYDQKFKKSKKNDPIIMEYIEITDVDPNYLKNIEFIKKYALIDLFLNSNDKKEKKFYSIILNKVRKIKDLESIFNIFQMKRINQGFTFLINGKMNQIKLTILDINFEKNPEVLNIINDWVKINIYIIILI